MQTRTYQCSTQDGQLYLPPLGRASKDRTGITRKVYDKNRQLVIPNRYGDPIGPGYSITETKVASNVQTVEIWVVSHIAQLSPTAFQVTAGLLVTLTSSGVWEPREAQPLFWPLEGGVS